ncbi:MAG: cation transporter [Candidatus Methylomirabilia bacterium]
MKAALKEIDGVISADVSFSAGAAVVTYDSEKTSPEALVSAINDRTIYRASLEATTRQIALAFDGELDPQRISWITAGLKEVRGVADVGALDGRVSVAYDPLLVDATGIIAAAEGMGYAVTGVEPISPAGEDAEAWGWLYWSLSGLLLLSALLYVYRLGGKKRANPEVSDLG